jgi:hypothetical protein
MKIEPNEPNTVLLMGQVCRAMGKLAQAVQMMTIARDLDPKNAQKINRMIEAFKAESSKPSSTLGDWWNRGVSGRGNGWQPKEPQNPVQNQFKTEGGCWQALEDTPEGQGMRLGMQLGAGRCRLTRMGVRISAWTLRRCRCVGGQPGG